MFVNRYIITNNAKLILIIVTTTTTNAIIYLFICYFITFHLIFYLDLKNKVNINIICGRRIKNKRKRMRSLTCQNKIITNVYQLLYYD